MEGKKEEERKENDKHTEEHKKKKERKKVAWDWKTLEENEIEAKLHPCEKPVTEPKTPYTPYEEGDDEYLKRLNEVNKMPPTEDVVGAAINKLEKEPNRKDSQEYLEVEVVESDNSVRKELIKDCPEQKEFKEKMKNAYKNEFTEAKKFQEAHEDEEKLVETTLKNTLKNKYAGMTQEEIKNKEITNK